MRFHCYRVSPSLPQWPVCVPHKVHCSFRHCTLALYTMQSCFTSIKKGILTDHSLGGSSSVESLRKVFLLTLMLGVGIRSQFSTSEIGALDVWFQRKKGRSTLLLCSLEMKCQVPVNLSQQILSQVKIMYFGSAKRNICQCQCNSIQPCVFESEYRPGQGMEHPAREPITVGTFYHRFF